MLFDSKKLVLTALTALMAVFLFIGPVEARQGCCSYHGGVCGCGCCDGSSLSAKCAPYYPSCNIIGGKETDNCKNNIWKQLAPGDQPCNYGFGDWITGWGLVYGFIGLVIYGIIKK